MIQPVLQLIRNQYALRWDGLHGVGHWARVYCNGMRIADVTAADREVILYFAVFHDACRLSERKDPGHGRRGAELAAHLHGTAFELEDARFALLFEACELHTEGKFHPDPTVQACWDSDRLDLARAHITPSPSRLLTGAARDLIGWASERSRRGYVPHFVAADWRTQP